MLSMMISKKRTDRLDRRVRSIGRATLGAVLILSASVGWAAGVERYQGLAGPGVETDRAASPADDLGEIVGDPGFETGSPNSSWAEESSNFGTPLCSELNCGVGGGTGPNGGEWWAWFGGIAAPEEGAVRQSVTLPGGDLATLRFSLEMPACSGDSADFLEVLVDGEQVFEVLGDDPRCTQIGYVRESVDISFALGETVELEFHSVILGSDVTNFFVDDVAIEIDGCELQMHLDQTTVASGASLPFTVHIQHNRPKTVTVPLSIWIEDEAGLVISSRLSSPQTLSQGDHRSLRSELAIPAGTPAGTYELVMGISEMTQGVAWGRTPFTITSD